MTVAKNDDYCFFLSGAAKPYYYKWEISHSTAEAFGGMANAVIIRGGCCTAFIVHVSPVVIDTIA